MSWTADAATGVYKNFSLSAKIRDAAVANSQFMLFADTEPGYGKGKGGTHTITRVGNLPLASTVNELTELPSGRPLIDTVSLSPSEWGYKVLMTEFETNLTYFDLTNKIQRALRDQLRLTMDKMVADAMKATVWKVSATSTSAIVTSSSSTTADSTVNFNATHLGLMRDIMMGDLKCPTFADGSYVLLASTKVVRGLKSDPNYLNWLSPQRSQAWITGEIPRIENVRIIETNHFSALKNNSGVAGVTGEAVMFGADAAFLATVDEPELRRGLASDLGRFYEIGWVGTTQAGLTWNNATQARCLHWTGTTLS